MQIHSRAQPSALQLQPSAPVTPVAEESRASRETKSSTSRNKSSSRRDWQETLLNSSYSTVYTLQSTLRCHLLVLSSPVNSYDWKHSLIGGTPRRAARCSGAARASCRSPPARGVAGSRSRAGASRCTSPPHARQWTHVCAHSTLTTVRDWRLAYGTTYENAQLSERTRKDPT